MSLHPSQNDEQFLVARIKQALRRSELGDLNVPAPLKDDLGDDIDLLCPIFFFSEQFDVSDDAHTVPFKAQQLTGPNGAGDVVLPGVGYVVAMVGRAGPALPDSSPGSPSVEHREVELMVHMFVPSVGGGSTLATTYASALSTIFSGYSLAPPGDAYGYRIDNIDHPPAVAAFVRPDGVWQQYRWEAKFVRSAKSTVAGPAPIPTLDGEGRVVVDIDGYPT